MPVANFLHSTTGRVLKVIVGIGLIAGGAMMLMNMQMWGWALIAVGALLLSVGTVNVCPLAPMFGGTFSGRKQHERQVMH